MLVIVFSLFSPSVPLSDFIDPTASIIPGVIARLRQVVPRAQVRDRARGPGQESHFWAAPATAAMFALLPPVFCRDNARN